MKKAIELTKKAGIKGVKLEIVGRLAGKKLHVLNASKRALGTLTIQPWIINHG